MSTYDPPDEMYIREVEALPAPAFEAVLGQFYAATGRAYQEVNVLLRRQAETLTETQSYIRSCKRKGDEAHVRKLKYDAEVLGKRIRDLTALIKKLEEVPDACLRILESFRVVKEFRSEQTFDRTYCYRPPKPPVEPKRKARLKAVEQPVPQASADSSMARPDDAGGTA